MAEYDLGFRGQIYDVGNNVENITFVDEHLKPKVYAGALKFSLSNPGTQDDKVFHARLYLANS